MRKAARAGPAGVFDRLMQIARLPAERRAAAQRQPLSELWRSLDDGDPDLRGIRALAMAGDTDRAQDLLLAHASRQQPVLPAAADIAATVRLARDRFPQATEATVAAADRAVAHRFTLFDWMDVAAGPEINWLREPTSGIICPLEFWADLDFESGAAGEVRVLWELNRHHHMLDLARAYCLTGDPRYAREVEQQMRSWAIQNPWGVGVNWASSLEVALRAIAWMWARSLLLAAGGLSPAHNAGIVAAVGLAGVHIARHLSYTYSPNTHLLAEALGLVYIGAMMPELSHARRWRALGRRILIREAGRQFLADGFHFEHSTWYHRFATDLYLHAVLLCGRIGMPLPQPVVMTVQRMLECLDALGARCGEAHLIGDDDGGQALPLAHAAARDVRPTMAVGAATFQRGDLKPEHGESAEAVLWMLGPEGLAAYDSLTPEPPAAESRRLNAARIAIMRSPGRPAMIFDCGDHAAPYSAHGHAGALAIQLRSASGPLLTDAGTYGYTDALWRRYFRGTSAHNTIVIDGASQSRSERPFEWEGSGEPGRSTWVSNPGFDLAEGSYDWPEPAIGVVHSRRILYVKPEYWLVVDLVSGAGEHLVEQWFHFPPCSVSVDTEGRCSAETPGGRLRLTPLPASCEAQIVEAQADPVQGWYSECFGRKDAAPALRYGKRTQLPAVFATLIAPDRGDSEPPALVRLDDSQGSAAAMGMAVDAAGYRDCILLAPADGRSRPFGPCASDGRAARVRTDASEGIVAASLCAGTFVSHQGVDIVRLERPADHLHLVRDGVCVSLWGETRGSAKIGWPAREVFLNGRKVPFRQAAEGVMLPG